MKMNDLRRGLCLLAALMMLAASVPVSAFAQELPATVHADAAELQAAPAAENNAAQGVLVNETNFPDPAFRAWLLRPENLNGAGADGLLADAELQAVTVMDVSNQGIASLQGIGYFTQLESLNCRGNQLTELDVNANQTLKSLNASDNRLTSLTVRLPLLIAAGAAAFAGVLALAWTLIRKPK